MKPLTHNKIFFSHLRAGLAVCLRWFKLDGNDKPVADIRQFI